MLFPNERLEGIDYILLRKHKTSFGNHKNSPNNIPRSTVSQPNCKCKQCRPDLHVIKEVSSE